MNSAGTRTAQRRQSTTVATPPVRAENEITDQPEIGQEDRQRAEHQERRAARIAPARALAPRPRGERAPSRPPPARQRGRERVAVINAPRSAASAAARRMSKKRQSRSAAIDADDDQDQRERGAIGVLAVLEGALVDVERPDRRVVERPAVGDQPDVLEAHQQRERLVERDEARSASGSPAA